MNRQDTRSVARRVGWRAAAALLAGALLPLAGVASETYYISPSGSDRAAGKSSGAAFKTFHHAFGRMHPGDELILLDGVYSEAAGTGHISYRGTRPGVGGANSGQAPSGVSLARPTRVRALNPGAVKVEGGLFVGRSTRKDRYITVEGITFKGGGVLYNANYVTVRNCGFNGPFAIGTNDHDQGNEHNLVEDVWIWAAGERIIAINYRSRFSVWRRVLVRGDGCGKPGCSGKGNPNVGITVYDSSDVSLQNVLVVDRVLEPGDSPYADFAVAQHTPGRYLFGRAEWLGTISLRSPDHGYYMEPDYSLDPTVRIENAIAWDSFGGGVNVARSGTSNVLQNLTVRSRGDGIRVAPVLTSGTLRNAIVLESGRFGINSSYPPSHVSVYRTGKEPLFQARCAKNCLVGHNPLADGPPRSLRYLPRIEKGSPLSGKGHDGADIGANVLFRYGRDGSRYGEPDYNALTAEKLWPWPNEERIRKEMCLDAGVTRGFCGKPSLTRYIWEYLGNPMPDDPYAQVAGKR